MLLEHFKRISDKLDWTQVYQSNDLSEYFIREFTDEVGQEAVSLNQNLSEDLTNEFMDKINLENISNGK